MYNAFFDESRILSPVFSCLLENGQFSVLFEACYPVLKRELEALASVVDVSMEEVGKKINSSWILLLDSVFTLMELNFNFFWWFGLSSLFD